ncbi:hypothetical protein AVEN_58708-1 [Araneus ventricosus]|uniref:Secreted protein n=1 Tax=Araneus ventricosus TaxID=182803 RepID=A0A4Y2JD51_ARAVE|nr:hypothetical protein AVEN_58708-1 [Araneus ventricosus]
MIVNTAISVAPQYDSVLFCLFMLSVVLMPHQHCLAKSCENAMPVILDNKSEEGDAPAPIGMVDEQMDCEDIELEIM